MPSADELAHRYSLASGQPLAHWDFYMALAYFKLAIIAAGIHYRARRAAAPPSTTRSVRPSPHCSRGLEALGVDITVCPRSRTG